MTAPLHHGRASGPVRRIVAHLPHGMVWLDCGHEVFNDTAQLRARCWRCERAFAEGSPASEPAPRVEDEPPKPP